MKFGNSEVLNKRINEIKQDIEWAEKEIKKLEEWIWWKRLELLELRKEKK